MYSEGITCLCLQHTAKCHHHFHSVVGASFKASSDQLYGTNQIIQPLNNQPWIPSEGDSGQDNLQQFVKGDVDV
jgi:hypothetical protein